MASEDLDTKTGMELLEEQKEKEARAFERHLQSLPLAITSNQILEAEKEYFDENVRKFKFLDDAKKRLLLPSDYQDIGNKKFIKKSGAKKLASAFKISTQILEHWESEHNWGTDKDIVKTKVGSYERNVDMTGLGREIIVTVRARAVRRVMVTDKTSGRTIEVEMESCEAMASCSNYELAQKKAQNYNYHNILATAETRATNRAILNLLGGEVSAEEVFRDEEV